MNAPLTGIEKQTKRAFTLKSGELLDFEKVVFVSATKLSTGGMTYNEAYYTVSLSNGNTLDIFENSPANSPGSLHHPRQEFVNTYLDWAGK